MKTILRSEPIKNVYGDITGWYFEERLPLAEAKRKYPEVFVPKRKPRKP